MKGVSLYARNLAVMFLIAVPVTAISLGGGQMLFRGSFSGGSLAGAIRDQLEAGYLLAWPIMVLIVLVHSVWLSVWHGRRAPVSARTRIVAAVITAALVAFVLGIADGNGFGPTLSSVAQFALVGLLYGVAHAWLVGEPGEAPPRAAT